MKRLDFLRRYEPRQVRGSAMLALSAPWWRSPVVRTSIAQRWGPCSPWGDSWTRRPMGGRTHGRTARYPEPEAQLRARSRIPRSSRGGLRARAPGPLCSDHQTFRHCSPPDLQALQTFRRSNPQAFRSRRLGTPGFSEPQNLGASVHQGRMPRWARAARTMCSWPWHISATTSSRIASAGVSQSRLSASRRGEHSPCIGRM